MTEIVKKVVYGFGGFDESKPDNNIIEIIYYTPEEEMQLEAQAQAEAKRQTALAKLAALGLEEEDLKALGL